MKEEVEKLISGAQKTLILDGGAREVPDGKGPAVRWASTSLVVCLGTDQNLLGT